MRRKNKNLCKYPGCKTILNSRNRTENFCYAHQRTIAQNNLTYVPKRYLTKVTPKVTRGFYRRDPRTVTRAKGIRPLSSIELSKLHGAPREISDSTE